jgi:uncharacterized protein (TIGR02246 family)
MENELEALEQRRQEWIAIVNAGAVDQYAALLTLDAVWLPPGQPALSGQAAIRRWLHPFFASFRYEYTLAPERIRLAGNWVVEHGGFTSTITPKAGGERMQHRGRYIVLWRREPDGSWYIERYIDETAQPASSAAPSS